MTNLLLEKYTTTAFTNSRIDSIHLSALPHADKSDSLQDSVLRELRLRGTSLNQRSLMVRTPFSPDGKEFLKTEAWVGFPSLATASTSGDIQRNKPCFAGVLNLLSNKGSAAPIRLLSKILAAVCTLSESKLRVLDKLDISQDWLARGAETVISPEGLDTNSESLVQLRIGRQKLMNRIGWKHDWEL